MENGIVLNTERETWAARVFEDVRRAAGRERKSRDNKTAGALPPAIPGMDTREGMQRASGKIHVYTRLLRCFTRTHG
ncbi:MAG: hypothetical protein MI892_01815, partial [Desulfobacterales bacterium]|nr:hypothetical protein [Desulfobacterales bacterium]